MKKVSDILKEKSADLVLVIQSNMFYAYTDKDLAEVRTYVSELPSNSKRSLSVLLKNGEKCCFEWGIKQQTHE